MRDVREKKPRRRTPVVELPRVRMEGIEPTLEELAVMSEALRLLAKWLVASMRKESKDGEGRNVA